MAITAGGALLTLGLLFWALAPSSAHRALGRMVGGYEEIRLGASDHTATAYALSALGGQLRDHRLIHVPTAGSTDNLDRLRRGELDAAFVQGGLDIAPSGVGAAASVAEEVVHVLVPAESEVSRFAELAGRRIHVGRPGGGTHALATTLVAAFGLTPPPVEVESTRERLEELFARSAIDAAIVVTRLGNDEMADLLRGGGFRLLALPQADALALRMPGTFVDRIPRGAYGPGRTLPSEELPTLAVHMNLLVRERISPDVVHRLLEAVYALPYLRAAHLLRLDETGGREAIDVPLHPAADAYYRRNDPVSSDRFEIAAFFLGLLIALIGFVRYLADQRRRFIAERRRARIRPFFEQMVTFAERIEAADADEVEVVHHEMMQNQREAERLWLDGELETEDMENLYAVYNARALDMMQRLQRLQRLHRAGLVDDA